MKLQSSERERLFQLMKAHFNIAELQYIVFATQIDSEELRWQTKSELIQELILFCERANILDRLLINCQRSRPNVDWPEVSSIEEEKAWQLDVNAEPKDGIYLTRLIEDETGKQTVWITTRGPAQYILDSMKLKFISEGIAGPMGSVTLPPDADYKFSYNGGTDRVDALNPALSLGPETRQVASFTISTGLDETLYLLGGLAMWIQYQTSDGRTGTLLLSKPSPTAIKLMRLLKQDIGYSNPVKPDIFQSGRGYVSQIVTPHSLLLGLEEQDPPELHYIPLHIAYRFGYLRSLDRENFVAARQECRRIVQVREKLHEALAGDQNMQTLIDWHGKKVTGWGAQNAHQKTVADLLGGIPNPESTKLLEEWFQNDASDFAVYGLCVRHLVERDEWLLNFAWENLELLHSRYVNNPLEMIAITLSLEPVSGWFDVIVAFKESLGFELVRFILAGLKEELTDDELALLGEGPVGPFGTDLYVRGTMNSWEIKPTGEAKLEYIGDWKYRTTLELDSDRYELKIADENWNSDTNLGAETAEQKIIPGKPFLLYANYQSNNIVLDLRTIGGGAIQFTMDVSDISNPTLVVTKTN